MSGLLGFLVSNNLLAARNPKFRTEIEPEMQRRPFFFWCSPEFEGKIVKIGAEIESVCGQDLFFVGLHLNLGAKF